MLKTNISQPYGVVSLKRLIRTASYFSIDIIYKIVD